MEDRSDPVDILFDENWDRCESFIYHRTTEGEHKPPFLKPDGYYTDSDGEEESGEERDGNGDKRDGNEVKDTGDDGRDRQPHGHDANGDRTLTEPKTFRKIDHREDGAETIILYSTLSRCNAIQEPCDEGIARAKETVRNFIESGEKPPGADLAIEALEYLYEASLYSDKLQTIANSLEDDKKLCKKTEAQQMQLKALTLENDTLKKALMTTVGGIATVVMYGTCLTFAGGLLCGSRLSANRTISPAILAFLLGMAVGKLR